MQNDNYNDDDKSPSLHSTDCAASVPKFAGGYTNLALLRAHRVRCVAKVKPSMYIQYHGTRSSQQGRWKNQAEPYTHNTPHQTHVFQRRLNNPGLSTWPTLLKAQGVNALQSNALTRRAARLRVSKLTVSPCPCRFPRPCCHLVLVSGPPPLNRPRTPSVTPQAQQRATITTTTTNGGPHLYLRAKGERPESHLPVRGSSTPKTSGLLVYAPAAAARLQVTGEVVKVLWSDCCCHIFSTPGIELAGGDGR